MITKMRVGVERAQHFFLLLLLFMLCVRVSCGHARNPATTSDREGGTNTAASTVSSVPFVESFLQGFDLFYKRAAPSKSVLRGAEERMVRVCRTTMMFPPRAEKDEDSVAYMFFFIPLTHARGPVHPI